MRDRAWDGEYSGRYTGSGTTCRDLIETDVRLCKTEEFQKNCALLVKNSLRHEGIEVPK